uniref:Uncharacterized protein n=1 Tax=Timema poppense TaxID=170557 RepID=A0A7R9CSS3_TIMPO|nr:unnamed protein product [Timema poppensis]
MVISSHTLAFNTPERLQRSVTRCNVFCVKYSSPMTSLVLTDSSQLTSDSQHLVCMTCFTNHNGLAGLEGYLNGYVDLRSPLSTISLLEFRYLNAQRPFQWVGGHQPRAEPLCGFWGERCVYRTDWRITAPLCMLLALAAVAAVFSLRHYRYEQRLACLLWKIDIKDVTIIPSETVEQSDGNLSMIQVCRHSVFQAPGFNLDQSDLGSKRAYIKIGLYRGNIVAIKKVYKRHIDITRNIRKELKQCNGTNLFGPIGIKRKIEATKHG